MDLGRGGELYIYIYIYIPRESNLMSQDVHESAPLGYCWGKPTLASEESKTRDWAEEAIEEACRNAVDSEHAGAYT